MLFAAQKLRKQQELNNPTVLTDCVKTVVVNKKN
jgi:hypothetical protein